MQLSNNEHKRRRQLANLEPGNRLTPGARSEAKLAPLREQFAVELEAQFPSATWTEHRAYYGGVWASVGGRSRARCLPRRPRWG